MRKWAYFPGPISYGGEAMEKIMLYQRHGGETCVFLYAKRSSQICSADELYPTLRDALSAWGSEPHSEWIAIDDPAPGCQEDAFDQIRVRGRADGKPEWGRFEILRGGEWLPYSE